MRSLLLIPKDHPMSSSITFRRRLSPCSSVSKRLRHLIPCVLLSPPRDPQASYRFACGSQRTKVSISTSTSPRSQSLHNSVKRIISYQLKHIRQTRASSRYTQYLWRVKGRCRATALGEGMGVSTEHEARRSRPHPRSAQAPDLSRDA
jgi:hypothetical protein